ncbi:MAG TPA: sugar-binding protein [Leptospiraceae bacterium]|nr:sugar-binding protein [Leptospiraceae bacterium]HMW06221.1 sugar-binding protein [Leptospiraceae bacterium]HMX34286.1 sugar-binding protein [Leptospiraceae bacterium]HMY31683.1 sugar-binding protein [Leptospiraceae bacterium]HMZ67464.1 sugar-binding protein [Leptospiraceae bacterium]
MNFSETIWILILALVLSCSMDNSPKLKGFFPNVNATASNQQVDSCISATPSNPTSVTITTTTSPDSIRMQWTNPTDCPIGGVIVRRKTGSSPSDYKDGTSISVNSNNTSFTDNSVSPSVLYYYKIFIYNTAGTLYSSGLSAVAIAGSTSVVPTKVGDNVFTLDGLDSESAWASSPKISFSFPVLSSYLDYTGGGDLNVTGYIRFAYDSSNFYIFYHTDDKYLRTDDTGAPWTDDSVELFFDMGYDRSTSPDTNDFKFIFTPANPSNNFFQQGNGAGWSTTNPTVGQAMYTSGCTFNTDGDIDSGWNMEMKIPFSILGVSSIAQGQVIGFTFYINDDDLSAFSWAQHMFAWTTGTVHSQPNTWGILTF